jgi:alkylation response protein AidB-like acyl-CoA dehydrogenase
MIFTEEQELFRKSVREFAEKEIAPLVPQILETNTYPPELLEKAAEIGIVGANYPEEWGGLGLGQVEVCIIFEEICKVCPGFALSIEILLVSTPLFNNEAMREKYLPDLLAGKCALGAAGTPTTGQVNTAESEPIFTKVEGGYKINGTRVYASNHDSRIGKVYGSDTEGNYMYAFYDTDMGGVYPQGNDKKVGIAGNNGGTIVFKDVFVPTEMTGKMVVGASNGYYQVYGGCAAEALGVAKGIFEKTVEWCKTRTHDFKPLVQMSAVRQKLAELKMKIIMAEALVYDCATMQDAYYASGDEELGARWRQTAEATKVQVSELLVPVAFECVKLHGGMGYHDPNIWHYLGDQLDYTQMDLTNEIHYEAMAKLMGII